MRSFLSEARTVGRVPLQLDGDQGAAFTPELQCPHVRIAVEEPGIQREAGRPQRHTAPHLIKRHQLHRHGRRPICDWLPARLRGVN